MILAEIFATTIFSVKLMHDCILEKKYAFVRVLFLDLSSHK